MDADEILIAVEVLNNVAEAQEANDNRGRVYYRRRDPFIELSDQQFIKHFRLNKNLTRQLIQIVSPFLEQPRRRSSLTPQTKVC